MQITRSTRSRGGVLAALLALVLALAIVPAAASAATPKYPVGTRVTFSVTPKPPLPKGTKLYLTVASKRKLDKNGGLKRTAVGTFASMKRKKGGVYKYTTPNFSFDTWFMQRPGTYWWQTSYVDCDFADCYAYSKVRSFKVVAE